LEAIRIVVARGYGDYARAKFANAQARLDDLEQLSQYALRYDDVNEFLDEIALANPIAGEDVATVGPEDEKIVLSSVHQAKGLEWRTVFVIWLADGRFPSQRALRVPGGIVRVQPNRVHEALPLLEGAVEQAPIVDEAGTREIVIPGEEEERRLFYVAVTRARQELYLVFPVMARDRMQMDILMEPSRFVRELPEEVFEKWVISSGE
jgi:DNA helicase-2/ATP-dependent DNA helicase PcrA